MRRVARNATIHAARRMLVHVGCGGGAVAFEARTSVSEKRASPDASSAVRRMTFGAGKRHASFAVCVGQRRSSPLGLMARSAECHGLFAQHPYGRGFSMAGRMAVEAGDLMAHVSCRVDLELASSLRVASRARLLVGRAANVRGRGIGHVLHGIAVTRDARALERLPRNARHRPPVGSVRERVGRFLVTASALSEPERPDRFLRHRVGGDAEQQRREENEPFQLNLQFSATP